MCRPPNTMRGQPQTILSRTYDEAVNACWFGYRAVTLADPVQRIEESFDGATQVPVVGQLLQLGAGSARYR
ncbi:hypothetical protein SAMN05660916_01323 [Arthrobacter sp. 31Cvi3.1E]|nr:hypothetical protein SAMN05660916_01323 [Arthrobacter sp. 31Cvi3.1E]